MTLMMMIQVNHQIPVYHHQNCCYLIVEDHEKQLQLMHGFIDD